MIPILAGRAASGSAVGVETGSGVLVVVQINTAITQTTSNSILERLFIVIKHLLCYAPQYNEASSFKCKGFTVKSKEIFFKFRSKKNGFHAYFSFTLKAFFYPVKTRMRKNRLVLE